MTTSSPEVIHHGQDRPRVVEVVAGVDTHKDTHHVAVLARDRRTPGRRADPGDCDRI